VSKRNFLLAGILVTGLFFTPYAVQFFVHKYFAQDQRTTEYVTNRISGLIQQCERENEALLNMEDFSLSKLRSQSKRWSFDKIVYEGSLPVYWTSRDVLPGYRTVKGAKHTFYYETSSWKFILVINRSQTDENELSVVSVIPLSFEPPIINEFIKPEFNKQIFDFSLFDIKKEQQENYQAILYNDEPLFYIYFNQGYHVRPVWVNGLYIALTICFLAGLIWYFRNTTLHFIRSKKSGLALLWLAGLLGLSRFAMITMGFPGEYLPWSLFDAKIYASSDLNPSLGDLLINITVGMIYLVVLNRYLSSFLNRSKWMNRISNDIAGWSMILLSFGSSWLFWQIFYALNQHSSWSYDIFDLYDINYLKVIGLLIVLIMSAIYFIVNHILVRMLLLRKMRFSFIVSSIVLSVLVIISLIAQNELTWIWLIHYCFLILILYLKLPQKTTVIQYSTFFYFIITALTCASFTYVVLTQFKLNKLDTKLSRMADQLMVDNDFYAEYLIEESAARISNDVFIQNRMFSPYAGKDIIIEKVKRVYLGPYFERYDISIVLYNANGIPYLERNAPLSVEEVNEIIDPYRINEEGLYFINSDQINVPKRYLKIIEIKRYKQTAGYILLDLRQKKVIPNTLYPLLLADARFPLLMEQTEYAYGVFSNGIMVSSFGPLSYTNIYEYAADRDFFNKNSWSSDGYDHHAFGDEERRIIISVKKGQEGQDISNLSFYFLWFSLGILVVITFYLALGYRKGRQNNLSTRIQIYLNLAFFIPLAIITISSISLISKIYRENLEKEYIEKTFGLHDKISDALSIPISEDMEQEYISNELVKMARFAETDINMFSMSGKLIATSQQAIFQSDFISDFIAPEALYHIRDQQARYIILEESIGKLSFKNIYMGIKSFETGNIVAIISIPFFKAEEELSRQVINILTRELNIFTSLFLVLFFISYFLSRALTSPLRLIGDKMRKLSFSSANEPIDWKSDDEIGKLIMTYNSMLRNLEDSRKALAKSEKESAWREMARQVAHEIKNPLTPMKLTLQHLQRIVMDREGSDNLKEQINALLQQVDTLSDIASSFSAFAKMPAPVTDSFDFKAMLDATVTTYRKNEIGQVVYQSEMDKAMVNGDEKWLSRAISNIIINGLQAAQDNIHPLLEVNLKHHNERTLRLTIRDNGTGIPEEIQEKIFTPNFSTKSSGSGLGLAIAKKAVVHAGGKIWFETTKDRGTVFYIELPLLHV
jgi:two-component system nitrogen regulation sensor histidine kinase NtrY